MDLGGIEGQRGVVPPIRSHRNWSLKLESVAPNPEFCPLSSTFSISYEVPVFFWGGRALDAQTPQPGSPGRQGHFHASWYECLACGTLFVPWVLFLAPVGFLQGPSPVSGATALEAMGGIS